MIKVATYCRVSTDRDDQANSFESQQKYFADYIERQPEWELYRVYADEGITGTSTKKRVEFNHMIRDARAGKFSLILTKEVSRFSRNILDTISFTRELRALGVGVLFMNDGINTLDPDAELRLSIMASIAQEESRKTSSRVKWGQTRQMEKGVVFGRSMIGYDVEGGKMTINPEGADIVRLIFHKYGREKKGTSIIARELREAGYRSYRGDVHWTNTQILRILRNEKYVGDLVQKKTITPDYLTHEKKYNRGEEQMVVIKNHHEPIIDRELWDMVQAEIERRNNHGKYGVGHANRYVFSGKIKCGACGERYVSSRRERKSGRINKRWACYNTRQHGKKHIDKQGNEVGCDIAVVLPDDLAMDMMKKTVSTLRTNKTKIVDRLTSIVMQVLSEAQENAPTESIEELETKITAIKKKKEVLLDEYLSLTITKADMILMNKKYDTEIADLEKRIERTKEQAELLNEEGIRQDIAQNISIILAGDIASEAFYKSLLREMVVYPENVVEIELNLLPMKWVYLLDSFDEGSKTQSDVENFPQDVVRKITQNDTPLGTEELAHVEIISTMLYQLTRGISEEEIKRAGFDKYFVDHTTGVYPQAAAGPSFTTAYIGVKGDVIADLNEDLAAEQKARVTYDNLLRLVDDPDARDVLRFLREREIVHYQRFGEALGITRDKMETKQNFYAYNPAFTPKR